MNKDTECRLKDHVGILCERGRVPRSAGYKLTQTYLCDQIASLGHVPLRQFFTGFPFGRCCNIYVETGPEVGSRIVVGAHYETLGRSGPGADDNASAVAVTLEMIRRAPDDLPMTFVFFDYEEDFGLGRQLGSKKFVRDYDKPIDKAIIFDLVGGHFMPGLEPSFFQFGSALPGFEGQGLEFFHLPMRFVEPLGKCGSARSDYGAFQKRSIPFTFLSVGTPWYYHTKEDTPDRLDYTKMARLVDCLSPESLSRAPPTKPLDWRQFRDLMARVCEIPAIEDPFFRRLASDPRDPSRWDILKVHFKVLPKLKKFGPDLWDD